MGAFRAAGIVAALGAVAATTVGVSALASARSGHHKPSASELVGRDPGKRVGGNTIVVTGNGEKVLGVPDRPNFIVALGSGDKITGGDEDNELGALGQNDTIVADRSHELIVAGPHGKVIVGGSGRDLVVDTYPGGTIKLESSNDEVIDTGHDDHIVCTRGAVHDIISDNKSDTVNRTCHKNHDPVRPVAKSVLARDFAPPVARAAAVSGDGSNSNPFTAPCDTDTTVCTVSSFASRTFSGFWANEYVPAYSCPSDHPYLYNASWAPVGTLLPKGVEVQGLGPIGVSISRTSPPTTSSSLSLRRGTLTDESSATNWTAGTASYKVILHCTSDTSRAYYG